jgi:hypothetical protein
MDDLIRKWLWMQTMNYALETLKWHIKPDLYPMETENEWRFEDWDKMQKNIFNYILDNWPDITYSGKSSSHSRYDTGYDLTANNSSVTGEYKNMTIEIKWPEVKRFIQKMLSPDMEDRQMDLIELLAEVSHEKADN